MAIRLLPPTTNHKLRLFMSFVRYIGSNCFDITRNNTYFKEIFMDGFIYKTNPIYSFTISINSEILSLLIIEAKWY